MAVVARPFQAADTAALVAVHNAVDEAAGRAPSLTAERLAASPAAPDVCRWVAVAPDRAGEVVGYGVLLRQNVDRCYADLRVHPAWRRQGVGGRLLAEIAAQAQAWRARWLTIDVDAANQDALRFLLTQGFRYRGDTWALLAPADIAFSSPAWPVGYTARTYAEAGTLPLLVEVSNRGFGDMWGHWENSPGLVDEAHMAHTLEQFDAAGIFLVFDASGAAVAHCRTIAAGDAEQPHILDEPGIVPEHRAAGLHAPLVLTAAHWLRAQGERPIRLESWGDTADTVALYTSLGFTCLLYTSRCV